MIEAGFALLIAAVVVAVAVVVRTAAGARREEADRRLIPSDESGVGLTRTIPPPPRPAGGLARFDEWFDVAVRRSGMDASPAGVVAVMILLAAAFGGGLYLWRDQFGLTALGVVLGLLIPLAVVVYYHRRYRAQLQAQLPDAIRMLAGSVRAGQSLEEAIGFYARHGVQPLASEFEHCAALMRLGLSPAAALQSVANRVRLLDFDLLASTVGLYTQTGGNLVVLLDRLADSVRERNQFAGQFFAATAQGRIVAVGIAAVAPLILLGYVLFEPEHVQVFFNSSTGWTLLAGCAVLEVIGVVWLWQILRIDY